MRTKIGWVAVFVLGTCGYFANADWSSCRTDDRGHRLCREGSTRYEAEQNSYDACKSQGNWGSACWLAKDPSQEFTRRHESSEPTVTVIEREPDLRPATPSESREQLKLQSDRLLASKSLLRQKAEAETDAIQKQAYTLALAQLEAELAKIEVEQNEVAVILDRETRETEQREARIKTCSERGGLRCRPGTRPDYESCSCISTTLDYLP